MESDPFWDNVWEQWAADAANDRSRRRERAQQRAAAAAAAEAPEARQRKPRKREEFKRLPLNPEEPAGSLARWLAGWRWCDCVYVMRCMYVCILRSFVSFNYCCPSLVHQNSPYHFYIHNLYSRDLMFD